MSAFDSFCVVDWNSGNDTGPTPKKDAIWAAAVVAGQAHPACYLRNRDVAMEWITELVETELRASRRLLIGFDFPFGYPAGFAERIVGEANTPKLWDFFAERLHDSPKHNNRFDLAGELNSRFPGVGPFWFNALKRDIGHLPRKGLARQGHGMTERRAVDMSHPGAFTPWQMGGAGAVGGQVMTGMAALSALRRRFGSKVSVWPFEQEAEVHVVEIWPSLIDRAVRTSRDEIRDRAQVTLLARALSRISPSTLAEMLKVDATEEGWILGSGYEDELLRHAMADLKPPRLKNDCFALPPGVDWTPVDEALSRLQDGITRVVLPEGLPLTEAQGRILATDVVAVRSNPPAANSAVDGYGFAHDATGDGDQLLPLVDGRAAAGAAYAGTVPKGSAIRILTGALLPEGVDTVVLEEDTTTDGSVVAFAGPLKPGANTRKAGEDVDAGDVALPAGTRLGPPELALLAATGVQDVSVYRPLRVGVLSTGDEIVPSGETPDAARTYDANRPMLLALIQDWGMHSVDLGHVGDDRAAVVERLNEASQRVDAILTSGGASAGDEDHIAAALGDVGQRNEWRIALKPGRPLALGLWQGVPLFALPGNPVAALVCTLVFGRPALGRMAGEPWREPIGYQVSAAFEKRKKPGRREYLRARMTDDGRVEVFASEGSGRISGLAWADGLVELPDGDAHIQPGDLVRYIPYSSFR